MIYKAEIVIFVPDEDQDIMRLFPDAVQDRFRGTPIRIDTITVTRKG